LKNWSISLKPCPHWRL